MCTNVREELEKTIKEDWEAAAQAIDEEFEDKGSIKKIVIAAVGVLLVILMLSYAFVTWPIGDILAGKLESSVLSDDFSITLDDGSVKFSEKALNELQQMFIDNEGQEFSVCLLGEVADQDFFINEIFQPETYFQSFSNVITAPCQKEALIHLHSHPHKRCIPSQQDLETFEKFKSSRENALMVVMCEKERFTVTN